MEISDEASSKYEPSEQPPAIYLVGAGVVGRAIMQAHIDAGVSIWLADQDEDALQAAIESLALDPNWQVSPQRQLGGRLPAFALSNQADSTSPTASIVIESIAERLDAKQSFFADAESIFGDDAILCSNTSTLRIEAVAEALQHPGRFCGMHFFMPVDKRPAVELIAGPKTDEATIRSCSEHATRINKQPLVVGDGPGFIVNRLLSPYLNESMLMLGRGVPAEQIERAALRYGMPLSPLELIDWIGTPTMFNAGRVYWQSFPTRIGPSPIVPALIKKQRLGRACGAGLYDYEGDRRSGELSPVTLELCEKYRRDEVALDDDELMHVLSIPMWIEAAIASREGISQSREQFDLAMRGGLGYDPSKSWLEFFESLGSETMVKAIGQWAPRTAAMSAPPEILAALAKVGPTEAIQ